MTSSFLASATLGYLTTQGPLSDLGSAGWSCYACEGLMRIQQPLQCQNRGMLTHRGGYAADRGAEAPTGASEASGN